MSTHFYCTAGRGTEKFVATELVMKFNISEKMIQAADGRVFFTADGPIVDKVVMLKSVERVFLQILHKKFDANNDMNTGHLVHVVQKEILAENLWKNKYVCKAIDRLIYNRQKFAQDNQILSSPSVEKGNRLKCETKHGVKYIQTCEANALKCKAEQNERGILSCEIQQCGRQEQSCETNISKCETDISKCETSISKCETNQDEIDTLAYETYQNVNETSDIRIPDANHPLCDSNEFMSSSQENTGPTPAKRRCISEHDINSKGNACPLNDQRDKCKPQRPTHFDMSKDFVMPAQVPYHNHLITFRVSCKCAGRKGRKIRPELLARQIGYRLQSMMGWKVNLKNPLIEISVHLNDESLTVGIPITKSPLSKRSYINHFGLRGTVAWIMQDLLDIQVNDIVLDPLCGKCTILVEAAKEHKDASFIGSDMDNMQLHLAEENIVHAGLSGNIQLLQCDTRAVPLADGRVNRVLTDAPFGKKFSTDVDILTFYNQFLHEMSRLLKSNGRMVLLTNEQIHRCLSKYRSLCCRKSSSPNVIQSEGGTSPERSTCVIDSSCYSDKAIKDLQETSVTDSLSVKNIKSSNINNEFSPFNTESVVETNKNCGCTEVRESVVSCGKNAQQSDEQSDHMPVHQNALDISVLQNFSVIDSHYIKLGETDSYIIILQKTKI